MPSVSDKQHKFMMAVGHDPKFAAKVGVPQSVGEKFEVADDQAGITKTPDPARIARLKRKLGSVKP